MASRIIILSLLLLVFISCTSQTAKLLGGSDKEIYDSITSELAKKKTLYIFGGPRFSKVEDMLLTLQVRYPYSEYTRETYLINGDVSYRTKDYYDAIEDYEIFLEEQPNHPKINYAKYMIIKSYSKLMTTMDKDISPSKKVIDLFNNLSVEMKNSEYFPEIQQIYKKANILLLERTIYIANFYLKKESYDSSLKRIIESEKSIKNLITSNSEAQFIKIYCILMTDSNADKGKLIDDYAANFPKETSYIDDLYETIK